MIFKRVLCCVMQVLWIGSKFAVWWTDVASGGRWWWRLFAARWLWSCVPRLCLRLRQGHPASRSSLHFTRSDTVSTAFSTTCCL